MKKIPVETRTGRKGGGGNGRGVEVTSGRESSPPSVPNLEVVVLFLLSDPRYLWDDESCTPVPQSNMACDGDGDGRAEGREDSRQGR